MKAIGIILAGGNSERMQELSQKRAIAAMPVGGGYRCIDFALSNMANSGVKKVAVLTQYNARSLNEHLSSSKWWDFGRKNGGLYVFSPTITADNGWWYRGTADAIHQNIDFLKRSHEPYVIIATGDCVYKLDFEKLLAYHVEKKADITIVCKQMPAETDVSRFGVIAMDAENRIVEFQEKPEKAYSHTVSTGIYVLRRRQLIDMLEKTAMEDRHDFVRDILLRQAEKKVYAYKMEGYWHNISSVEDYYQTNMDFLDYGIRNAFCKEEPQIHSKVDDLAPAKYNEGADVKNSLVASGCIINGKVEGSIIFKKVFVGKNCVIKNSVILNECYIADNTTIENCVVESRERIPAGSYMDGGSGIKVVYGHEQQDADVD